MSNSQNIADELISAIGANDEDTTVNTFLDTGFPPLNNASSAKWNGGLPVGRMIEIAGPPSSGKTAIATAAMAAAQKDGGIAGFMDHERSFSLVLALQLGLDISPGNFVFKKPRTFEDSLQICVEAATIIRSKKLIDPKAPICWVFDSLASMVPKSALKDLKTGKDKEFGDRNMNDNTALARATSNHFPAFSQYCDELGICAIFLNQMRTDIGVMFGDNRKTTGGNAPEFYCSQRIWLSASMIKNKSNEIIGSEVTGTFKKNKVAAPFQTAKWRFVFQEDGTGRFDRERSMVEFLNNEGLFPEKNSEGKPAKKGFVIWNDKNIARETLARQIESEGEKGFEKLTKLLPAEYEPEIVATADLSE